MIFPSNILGIFSKHGGKIAPTDAQIQVAPLLSAVVDGLGQPMNLLGNGAGFPLQHQSFMLDSLQSVTNGAGTLNALIVKLAPGLWDLTLNWWYQTDDTGLPTRSSLYFQDPTTTLSVFAQYFLSVGQLLVQHDSLRIRAAILPQASWDLYIEIGNTAALKTTYVGLSVVANRLG